MSTDVAVTGSTGGVGVGSAPTPSVAGTSLVRNLGGLLRDVLLLLLAVLSLPLAILLIGTPIAICVRLILEIVRRL